MQKIYENNYAKSQAFCHGLINQLKAVRKQGKAYRTYRVDIDDIAYEILVNVYSASCIISALPLTNAYRKEIANFSLKDINLKSDVDTKIKYIKDVILTEKFL